MSNRLLGCALIAAGLSCAATVPARADPGSPASLAVAALPSAPAAKPVAVAVTAATRFANGALGDADLGNCRGSGGLVVGNQTLSAISSGNNTIASYTAGTVDISDSALSNFNGFGNITINTGALSQLQSAMNIVVNVNP